MVHPRGAVATHFSAARLRGVPVPDHPWEHVTVARPADRRQRHGLRCHVLALAAADIHVIDGLRVSAPHRMFVELAGTLGLVELVVVGDWLVRHRHVTVESLLAYCAAAHVHHAAAARRAAAYVRAGVDSPMETRLRLLLVLAGLPEPRVNAELRDDHGVLRARFDLSWPGVRLAVEYDGRQHLESVDQWEHDVERRDLLVEEGWRLVTVTSKGLYREPQRTVHRVWRALRDQGLRPLPEPLDDWRVHFGR
jgi:very-short-patch-repair endonuclease